MKSQSYIRIAALKQPLQWLAMAFCIVLLTLLLAPIAAYGQATTVVTATVKDVSGNVVPTGQVTFDLKPGIDTAINGNARFTPQTTVCTIHQGQNGGTGTITSLVRASGVVTATFSAQTTFLVGDTLSLCSWSDATFNGYNAFTVTAVSSVSPWTVTWNQVGVNSSATSGSISALRANPSGPCTVTQNTALTPSGTFYKVTFWPNFSPTSALNFYATTNTVDLASVVPTPATIPAYSFLDLYSNQTATGPKTFSGGGGFGGTFSGNFTLSGTMTLLNLPVFPTGTQNLFWATPNGSSGAPAFRAIVPADIPTLNQPTTANAGTATALAATPTTCGAGIAAVGITANGNATGCFTPSVSETANSQAGLTATATGATLVTILTPTTNKFFRVAISSIATTPAAGCTTNAVALVEVSYTDALSGSAVTPTAVITLTSGALGFSSLNILVNAKANVAIQAGINVTTAAVGCATFPVLATSMEALP